MIDLQTGSLTKWHIKAIYASNINDAILNWLPKVTAWQNYISFALLHLVTG